MSRSNSEFAIGSVSASELAREFGTPLYVYDEEKIREKARALRKAITYPDAKFLFACKANSNLEIMRILREEGCGIETVSPFEIYFAVAAGFKSEDILFTCGGVTDAEIKAVKHYGVLINIDSLSQLERYGKLYPDTGICLRINPAVGAGGHEHVITGGPLSKFGVYHSASDEALAISEKYRLRVAGVHMHVGSNILDSAPFIDAAQKFLRVASKFPDLRFIDFGGGIGIPYRPDQSPLDLKKFGKELSILFASWCKEYGGDLQMILENGRFFVAESGHLLARVVTIKETPRHKFAVTDSGFTHLIRPVLYNAYHEILNVTNPRGKKEKFNIVGNICETGDFFARDREIPSPREGDLLSIENAGAYCFSMAGSYNGRPLPAEVLVSKGKARIIRSRETIGDLLKTQQTIIKIAGAK